MRRVFLVAFLCTVTAGVSAGRASATDLRQTAAALQASKWAMFIHYSIATYTTTYGPYSSAKAPISLFNPTSVDTDQWARTAKEAGMGSLLFVAKHHDGFCLWNTQTTDRRVTNSPYRLDLLAKVRKSCDKYGLRLGLYYSGGDWTWPGAIDGAYGAGGGSNPLVKQAQLRELLTNYGKIDFMWFDAALGDGGLSDQATVDFVHSIQPNSVVATLSAGQMHDRNNIGPSPVVSPPFLINDVSQAMAGLDKWFYNPANGNTTRSAREIYDLYKHCKEDRNFLLLGLGPDRNGRLRDVDVATLQTVGRMIGVPESSSPTDSCRYRYRIVSNRLAETALTKCFHSPFMTPDWN